MLRNSHTELTRLRGRNMHLFGAVFLFSIFTNLLMLSGPLYMLQVYDRVLGSRSEETLVSLSILLAFLFLMMGLLDYVRGRVAARIGARLQDGLDARVFSASLTRARREGGPQTGLQDLESVQRLFSSPAFLAIFDIPWTPLFLFAIFLFHPWLGWLAVAGGGLLVTVAVLNQAMTRSSLRMATSASLRADRMAGQMQSEAELIRSLGMQNAVFTRWRGQRKVALGQSITAADRVGSFTSLSKTFRLFLQSAILGLGAYLVLQGQLTAGAMIAGSILLGRALAPIEMAIGQWALIQRAIEGWSNLQELLRSTPEQPAPLLLPRPQARLEIRNLAVIPPGESQTTLRAVSFMVEPGQALGVIGPSGAGKSTLARALTGVWPPASGHIRLDGATLDQYHPDILGRLIGYLPQSVTLFEGTIAENIARLDADADPTRIISAAKQAAAHEMILAQPMGYDTPVSNIGSRLSGGQIQRIALARALYSDPVLLVLDEPNSNLDNDGSEALNQAIRQMKAVGKSVLIMAHRPAAIEECDTLLMIEAGLPKAFGPRDEVLRRMVRNHAGLLHSIPAGAS